MPFKFETKAHQAVYDVDHRTLKASAGGILSDVKVEYLPNFTIRGSPLEFGLKGTEQTLLQPRQAKDLVAEAKCKVRPGLSAAARYAVGKRLAAYDIKADKYISGRLLKTQFKGIQGKPLAVESEFLVTPKNKLQVETFGKRFDAVKATTQRGNTQFKLKYIFPDQQPVVGIDTFAGSQKWDLEYNVKTSRLAAKVKVWPMSLAVTTTVGPKGVAPASYKVTLERQWIF